MSEENTKTTDSADTNAVADKNTASTSTPDVKSAKEEAKTEVKKVPTKFKTFIEDIEKMSVIELNELVSAIEDKFGVSASAVSAGPALSADSSDSEESATVTVSLTSAGEGKIAVMKVVKEVLGVGLKEAKDLVDGAPVDLKTGMKRDEANEFKKKLEEAGAGVEFK